MLIVKQICFFVIYALVLMLSSLSGGCLIQDFSTVDDEQIPQCLCSRNAKCKLL